MKNDNLFKLYSSLEEQVLIYEEKKKNICDKINNISNIDNKAHEYFKLKTQSSIVDALSISILTFLIFKCGFNEVNKVMLFSLFASCGSISFFNIYRFFQMKNIEDSFKNVDFKHYDFERSREVKSLYTEECAKIDEYILSLNKQMNAINNKIDYNCVDDNQLNEKKEEVFVKKLGGKK